MRIFLLLSAWLIAAFSLTNCQSNQETPAADQSPPVSIEQIIPPSLQDSLRRKGLVIHEGERPPALSGVFEMTPTILTANIGPTDPYRVGQKFADYRFQFSEYNPQRGMLKMRYKSLPSADQVDGSVVRIVGSNSQFTIFSESQGTDQGISYVSLTVISGELTSNGIRNFQLAFLYKSKGNDPNNRLLKVGQVRVFADGDGISPTTKQYRLPTAEKIWEQPKLGSL